jgi:hypothetical protein
MPEKHAASVKIFSFAECKIKTWQQCEHFISYRFDGDCFYGDRS